MRTDSFDFTAVVDDQDHKDWIDIDTMSQSPARMDSDIRSTMQIEINVPPIHDIGQQLQFELTTDWA